MVCRAAALADSLMSAASASEDSSVWSWGRPAVPGQTTLITREASIAPDAMFSLLWPVGVLQGCHLCATAGTSLTTLTWSRHPCCAFITAYMAPVKINSSVCLRHSCPPCGPCMLGRTRWTFSSL